MHVLKSNELVRSGATRRHTKLGWSRGYWTITSPHFVITTNTSQKRGIELARSLEELHTVWRQLFFSLWSNRDALKNRLGGGKQPLGPSRKHQVVFFRNREEYVQHIDRIEPRARITAGYYSASTATSYFFDGDEARRSSWFHEVTHQLFQETRGVVSGIGESANFWALEGVAMYMESLVRHDGYYYGWWLRRQATAIRPIPQVHPAVLHPVVGTGETEQK